MAYYTQIVLDILDFECRDTEISKMMDLEATHSANHDDVMPNGRLRKRSA